MFEYVLRMSLIRCIRLKLLYLLKLISEIIKTAAKEASLYVNVFKIDVPAIRETINTYERAHFLVTLRAAGRCLFQFSYNFMLIKTRTSLFQE